MHGLKLASNSSTYGGSIEKDTVSELLFSYDPPNHAKVPSPTVSCDKTDPVFVTSLYVFELGSLICF